MKHDFGNRTCQVALQSIDDALYVFGGKWKLKIIIAMKSGVSRFNELQRTLGISAKMLSQDLKDLELNEMVKRDIDAGPPVVIDYRLTEHADNLEEVLNTLMKFGKIHREKLKSEMAKS